MSSPVDDLMLLWMEQNSGEKQADNEVWYLAQAIVTLHDDTGVTSHTFADGKGVLTFAGAVTTLGTWLQGTVITGIRFPGTVTGISQVAFYNCQNLDIRSLPASITSIDGSAFQQCTSLVLPSLPPYVTIINNYTFYGCTSLALKTIGKNVTHIGTSAFQGCTSLTDITFKGKPTSIAADAFSGCTNLTRIIVPWAEGEVANAPWGATNAEILYFNGAVLYAPLDEYHEYAETGQPLTDHSASDYTEENGIKCYKGNKGLFRYVSNDKPITISKWVKFNAKMYACTGFWRSEDDCAYVSNQEYADKLEIRIRDTKQYFDIQNNKWYHVAMVITPTYAYLYIDGILMTGIEKQIYYPFNTSVALSTMLKTGYNCCANTKIYDRVLTQSEIAELAHELTPTNNQ